MILPQTPKKDGFFMPAEYSEHDGTVLIWPERRGSFPFNGENVKKIYANLVKIISRNEKVYLCVDKDACNVKKLFRTEIKCGKVEILNVKTDDCWARDTAPTFVTDGVKVRGVEWTFNAWGGEQYGLYKNWEKDDKLAGILCNELKYNYYSARPFVLEGGAIASNGNGIIMTTEECLLSAGRNPDLTKAQIERRLKNYLGASKIIWLPYGVYGDETGGHVDNACAFLSENSVALAWSDYGENAVRCRENLKVLEAAGLKTVKIMLPDKPVTYTEAELATLEIEEGEIPRDCNTPLAASYINFYVCNKTVIVPQFGDKNDLPAVDALQAAFPNREIVQIFSRDILLGGGNIHCITQQIPKENILNEKN